MKNLLLFCLVIFTSQAFAQSTLSDQTTDRSYLTQKVQAPKQFKGDEPLMGPVMPSPHWEMYLNAAQTHAPNKETWLGQTYYDLQTNSAGANRIYANPDCDIKVSWTGHPNTSDQGFPNRGTFLSESEDCYVSSPVTPTARIETGFRTGWGNILPLSDGSNLIVAHTTDDENSRVIISKEQADGSYTETALPTVVPQGILWPHATAVGNMVHIIAVSDPDTSFAAYEGLRLPLLYWRSQDGGDTWDIQDYIIPGLTADVFPGTNADQYSIVADENGNVAVGVYGRDQDILLLKSDSDGDEGSWTKHVVYDYPIDSLEYGVTDYTLDDIGGVNPQGPGTFFQGADNIDSLAIATNDGSGSVALDANGMAHMVYTEYFTSTNPSLGEGFGRFYTIPTGLHYWNESMAADSTMYIQETRNGLDVGGDGTINFTNISDDTLGIFFGDAAIGHPSMIINDAGEIGVVYRQVMDNLREEPAGGGQHFSHIMLIASVDGGANWSGPVDIINTDFAFFPPLVTTTNACFPNMAEIDGRNVSVMYQFDNEPGFNLNTVDDNPEDPIGENTIAEISFDFVVTAGIVATEEVAAPETFAMKLMPNPATDLTQLSYELTDRSNVSIEVTSITGQKVMIENQGTQSAGAYQLDLNTGKLGAGVYMVSIRTANNIATQRLIVTK